MIDFKSLFENTSTFNKENLLYLVFEGGLCYLDGAYRTPFLSNETYLKSATSKHSLLYVKMANDGIEEIVPRTGIEPVIRP